MDPWIRYIGQSRYFPPRGEVRAYDARLFFILGGRGEIRFGSRRAALGKGTLVIFPAGTPYVLLPSEGGAPEYLVVNFDFDNRENRIPGSVTPVPAEDFTERNLLGSPPPYPVFGEILVLENAGAYGEKLREIRADFEAVDEFAGERASAGLCRLLFEAFSERGEGKGAYGRVLRYLKEHLSEPLTNGSVAAALNYHPAYLSRVTRECAGAPLHAALQKMRLERGAELLRTTDRPVEQIAGQCGFVNAKHFSVSFRKTYGASPRQYRKENGFI